MYSLFFKMAFWVIQRRERAGQTTSNVTMDAVCQIDGSVMGMMTVVMVVMRTLDTAVVSLEVIVEQ